MITRSESGEKRRAGWRSPVAVTTLLVSLAMLVVGILQILHPTSSLVFGCMAAFFCGYFLCFVVRTIDPRS